MLRSWKHGVALVLGGLAGGFAVAGDPQEPPRRVIATSSSAPASASLSRPVPIAASGVVDPAVRPTTFTSTSSDLNNTVIRAQAPDIGSLKPMPNGPTDNSSAGPITAWRRSSDNPKPTAEPEAIHAPRDAQSAPTAPAAEGPTFFGGPIWSMMNGGCGDDATCACPADGCGCTFSNCFYFNAEYLLWWIKGSNTPPLVTQGSAGDPIPGALGNPGTNILFGGGGVEKNPFSGGRFTLGYWFGERHLLGLELSGFALAQQSDNFTATSFGNPILTRPFINGLTGTETVELVAAPRTLAGTVSVHAQSQLWGYEANFRSNFGCGQLCGCDYFVDGLLGFRSLGLNESLNVNESLVIISGSSAGGQFVVNDRFSTTNNFYGGQIGSVAEFRKGNWILDLTGKLALGTTQQFVRVEGSTITTTPAGLVTASTGGLLAGTTNIGNYRRDRFTCVPELGINVGYQCTDHLRLFVGYDIVYWSSVARPGNQIDRTVNPNLLPPAIGGGPARPAFAFNSSEFWAQGMTFGLEFKY